ncbi:MAG: hypothetical protein ACLQIB_20595 [Isosphaeraceae bacterium]
MDLLRSTIKPVKSYTTHFQLDEDPISEGGKWINGRKDGIDWYNLITKNGLAYGAVSKGAYTDPTALLAGTWDKNQTVKARAFSRNQYGVERSNGDFGFTSYEVDSFNE